MRRRWWPRAFTGLVAVSSLACSEAPRVVVPTASAPVSAALAPCDTARGERARVSELVAAGRLDRARRVLTKANALCADEARTSWAVEVGVLSELGDWPGATSLAARILGDPDAAADARAAAGVANERAARYGDALPDTDEAKAPMRAAYRDAAAKFAAGDAEGAYDGFLRAWELWHPNGQALIQAGFAAAKLGRSAESRRLFDRGLVELERLSRSEAAAVFPNGLDEAPTAVAWSSAGRIAIVQPGAISLRVQSSLQESVRIESARLTQSYMGATIPVAFSPDGKLVAAAGRVWNVSDGGEAAVTTCDSVSLWSADGSRVASPTGVCETNTGRVLVRLAERGKAVALSADGKVFAWSGDAYTVEVWSVDEGRRKQTLPAAEYDVASIAISPDDDLVAWSSWDGKLRVHRSTGARVCEKTAYQPKNQVYRDELHDVAFSPDGKLLASTVGSRIRLYAMPGCTEVASLPEQEAPIVTVAFSPSGDQIVTGGKEGVVRVWDVRSLAAPVRSVERHASGVITVATSGAGALATASVDGAAHVWSLSKPSGRKLVRRAPEAMVSVAFSEDGSELASASEEGRVDVARLAGSAPPIGFDSGFEKPFVAFSPSGDVAVTSADGRGLRLFERASAAPRTVSEDCRGISVAFSRDGDAVTCGSSAGTFRTLAVADGAPRTTFEGHLDPVLGVALSPDGKIVASASLDHAVRLWDAATGRPLGASDGCAHPVLEGHTDEVYRVAFAPDGKSLASVSGDRTVRVWAVPSGDPIATVSGHASEVIGIAWSSDGKHLVSSSADGSVDVHRVGAFDLVVTLRGIAKIDAAYAFTPDGYVEFLGADADAARAFPVCRVGAVSFPFEVCRDRFEVDGLIEKAMAGDVSYREP